ncbi:ArsR/SmtB family transcription factor [Vagococcus silagei]|uniref:ArsR family transcriptional regulator n=1 Tax=Vagococcus silagei TaxID=2508885 RepID=A0A4S3B6Z3_9ENTE|nr:metalloregulator ArsR/SmtB family transcription factor [Vagococcus silagei]THB60435.1 ArsR family transcriptional regulator [Vagococcus silagei]
MTIQDINDEELKEVSQFYKALSDPTRLKILINLMEEELNVSTLVERLNMEQSAVSHQLKLLRTNRLVKTRREGKGVYYSLDDQHVSDILKQTITHMTHH